MYLLKNIKDTLTLSGASIKGGRNLKEEDLGLLSDVSIVADDIIHFVGPSKDIPKDLISKIQTAGQIPPI